jgi:hypothetical protein
MRFFPIISPMKSKLSSNHPFWLNLAIFISCRRWFSCCMKERNICCFEGCIWPYEMLACELFTLLTCLAIISIYYTVFQIGTQNIKYIYSSWREKSASYKIIISVTNSPVFYFNAESRIRHIVQYPFFWKSVPQFSAPKFQAAFIKRSIMSSNR